MLHLEGREVQAIFKDLVDWGLVDATMEDVYYVCIQKLDARFFVQMIMYNINNVSSHGTTDTRIRRQVPGPLKKKKRQDIVILARNQLIEKLPDI